MAPEKGVPGKDGDGEVMMDSEIVQLQGDSVESEGANIDADISVEEGEGANIDADMSVVDASSDDGEEVLRLVEEECKDAILQMLDSVEPSQPVPLTVGEAI